MSRETSVTISQVAKLANVQTAAVSNWKRRHQDFPKPVGSAAGGRQLYSLAAVEEWLRKHDRYDRSAVTSRALFRVADLLRSTMSAERYREVICSVITLLYIIRHDETQEPISHGAQGVVDVADYLHSGNDKWKALLEPLLGLESQVLLDVIDAMISIQATDLPTLFEAALDKGGRYEGTRSSESLSALLVELAKDEPASVLDPAAGEGGFLLIAARHLPESVRFYGQEISKAAWRIASQRMLVHEIDAEIHLGDSLSNDAYSDLRVDLVLCDPPYGVAVKSEYMKPDARWTFGLPPKNSSDYLWLQHCIYHLSEDGSAYVLLPPGSLFHGKSEGQMRAEMLRSGVIESIVMLPPGTAEHTNIPLALWIVRRPIEHSELSPVILIDAEKDAQTKKRGQLDRERTDRIVSALRRWRRTLEIPEGDSTFAAAVPVLDLLGEEVNLTPKRWVSYRIDVDPDERRRAAEAAGEKLEWSLETIRELDPQLPSLLTEGATLRWIPVRDLIAGDVVTTYRGVYVRPEDCGSEGIRVLRTRDIKDGVILDVDPCYVEAAELKGKLKLTEVGDVIVGPGSGKLRAAVDDIGGRLLGPNLEALRFKQGWLDPYVAGAFLTSPRNRRFITGTTLPHVKLRDLELPVLSSESAAGLRRTLEQLVSYRSVALQLADATSKLRELLLDVGIASPTKGDGD